MTEAIATVTLENAADLLKAKIRSAFIDLLPDDQFKQMVQTELKLFMQPGRDSYHNREIPSPFAAACQQVFTEYVTGEMKKTLATPEWQTRWTAEGMQPSAAIESWLTKNSQRIIEATIHALAGQAAQQILDRLR